MSSSADRRNPVERLAEEFLERIRRGETTTPQEYAERHPDLADEILELFPALLMMEDLGGDTGDRTGVIDSDAGNVAGVWGSRLGDFRLLREIGRGGMGVVYEAEQESLGRRVALKVLPTGALTDQKQVRRFEREARSAARLHHTNIVPVFGVGNHDGTHFYVMQFIQGQGLDVVLDELKHMRNNRSGGKLRLGPGTNHGHVARSHAADIAQSLVGGRFIGTASPRNDETQTKTLGWASLPSGATHLGSSPTETGLSSGSGSSGSSSFSETDYKFAQGVARIGVQVAEALAYAHGQGILHRDIKPANLLLDRDGNVWVADFGLAKASGTDDLTHTGDIVGTVRYMAPERFQGTGDARADIYALGLTLYELLALRPAFDETDRASLIRQVTQEDAPRLRKLNRRVPHDLETIVHKSMAREAGQRYATAGALAEDLNRFIEGRPIVARPVQLWERAWKWSKRRPAIAALVVVVQLALGAMLAMGVVSYIQIQNALEQANEEKTKALLAHGLETSARKKADEARNAALGETYRASLSEVRALRAGHPPGWRDDALGSLARLARLPTARRDLVELRTEAVGSLGEFDVIETARLDGFRGNVWSLDFSRDSQTLLTASLGGDLHLWDLAHRRHRWQMIDPTGRLPATGYPTMSEHLPRARFLGDGGVAYIATDNRVAFLDAGGRPSARSPIGDGTARAVELVVDRRGRWIGVGWSDNRIALYDAVTGALGRSFRGQPGRFALSPDGQWLARIGLDQSLRLDRTEQDGAEVNLGPIHEQSFAFAFSPDGTAIAVSWDQTATIWNLSRQQERLTLRGHKEKITDVAFSPDGAWVATTSDDHTTRIWDARTGQTLEVLPGPWFMHNVVFSPDGGSLAVSSRSGSNMASVYRIEGRSEMRRLAGHNFGLQCLGFHPRLPRLASGADDCDIIIWDSELGTPLRRWRAHPTTYISRLAYSPDGSLLASGNGFPASDCTVRVWDPETGTLKKRLVGHRTGLVALAFDARGRRLATGDESGVVIVWDIGSERILRNERVGQFHIRSLAFLEDSRHVLAGSQGGSVAMIDTEGIEPTRSVQMPVNWGGFVVDAPRNRLIVADDKGGLTSVSLPDLVIGRSLPQAHDGNVWSLALSTDGQLLATGGDDRRVIVRNAETFEPLFKFPAWTGVVKDLCFDPSGKLLAFGGVDTEAALWDMGLLHTELVPLGLAWDRPPPSTTSAESLMTEGERSRPTVPVIRTGNTDPVKFSQGHAFMHSGIAAYENGRMTDAIRDLMQARDRLQPLLIENPGDQRLASELALSLGFLANALRHSQRAAEAVPPLEELRRVTEAMSDPSPNDLYNLACCYSLLSHLPTSSSSTSASAERAALADRAIGTLRRALAAGWNHYDVMDRDDDLDPLRGRPDFRSLIQDRGFPKNPFAGSTTTKATRSGPDPIPSSVELVPSTETYSGIGVTTDDEVRITALRPGGPAATDGRFHIGDTILGVEQVTLFTGKSQNEISSYLRGEVGSKVKVIVRPASTNRREVYEVTRAVIAVAPSPPSANTGPLDKAITSRPHDPTLRFQRGTEFARHGAWKAALADFREGLAHDPSDTISWMQTATLYLQLGDVQGYRRHARSMIEQFGATSDPVTAERVAKIGLLTAPSTKEKAQLTALADLAVTAGADTELLPWFQFARGMAAYRDGQFVLAEDILRKAQQTIGSDACKLAVEFYRAMSQARLGHASQARKLFDEARQALEARAPLASDLGEGWHDWLICWIALREAEALIVHDPIFPTNPFAR